MRKIRYLLFILLFSLLSVGVCAEEFVDIPCIEICGQSAPVAGQRADAYYDLYLSSQTQYCRITEQHWYDCQAKRLMQAEETFVEGQSYQQVVTVTPYSYVFLITEDTVMTLNGSPLSLDEPIPINGLPISLWSKPITAIAPTTLASVNVVGYRDPVLELPISDLPTLSVPVDAPYTTTASGWSIAGQNYYLADSFSFHADTEYQQSIKLKLKPGYRMDENTTFTVDGCAVSEKNCIVTVGENTVAFTSNAMKPKAPEEIHKIEVGDLMPIIRGGQVGACLTAKADPAALYTVTAQHYSILNGRSDLDEKAYFQKGELYYTSVTVKAKPGYCFAEDAECVINGGEIACFPEMTHRSTTNRYFVVSSEPMEPEAGIVIDHVEVENYTAPNHLDRPEKNTLTVPADAGYILRQANWHLAGAPNQMRSYDTFDIGKSYQVYVYLEAKPGYSFADDVTATVNGKPVIPAVYETGLPGNQLRLITEALKVSSCPSDPFTDLEYSSWAHEGIDYCLTHGYMNGTSPTLFTPKGTVTRGQLVTILHRMAGSPKPTASADFTDVAPDAWYGEAVAWAAENGIVNGYQDGTFRPMGNITREQIAAILYRYVGSPAVTGELDFPDSHTVSGYAVDAMLWATQQGYITGKAQRDGTPLLAPSEHATREQIASIIMRFDGQQA